MSRRIPVRQKDEFDQEWSGIEREPENKLDLSPPLLGVQVFAFTLFNRRIEIPCDLLKFILVVAFQALAIGIYLASLKSDLSHLSDDFRDIKKQQVEIRHQLEELRAKLK